MTGEPNPEFWRGRSVCVTGGTGFLGQAVVARLQAASAHVTAVRSADHDLRKEQDVREALEGHEVVLHLAARVGGIGYNRRNPASLAYENMVMASHVFEQARVLGVRKLVAVCSVCAYPKHTKAPFSERDLWAGYPEESNAPYGLAKRMLPVLSDAYRRQYGLDSCVPMLANLFGPNDNFDLEDSHVIPAMIAKFERARERGESAVTLWGTGRPSREFLYVEDASRALLLSAEHLDSSEPLNIGTGIETRIGDLAELVRELTGFHGEIVWDASRPDGQPTRYLDVSRAKELIGFEAQMSLAEGLRRTIASYRASTRPPAIASTSSS